MRDVLLASLIAAAGSTSMTAGCGLAGHRCRVGGLASGNLNFRMKTIPSSMVMVPSAGLKVMNSAA
jgi:hypothetical protein